VGGAVKILISFFKAIWKCGAFVFRHREAVENERNN
jgi:hypothetical protein